MKTIFDTYDPMSSKYMLKIFHVEKFLNLKIAMNFALDHAENINYENVHLKTANNFLSLSHV